MLVKYLIKVCTDLQVFELLEEHLAGSGPATPLLLTGSSGHGKTTMVAKWFVRFPNIPQQSVIFPSPHCAGLSTFSLLKGIGY